MCHLITIIVLIIKLLLLNLHDVMDESAELKFQEERSLYFAPAYLFIGK